MCCRIYRTLREILGGGLLDISKTIVSRSRKNSAYSFRSIK
jgi:hypothetical protein